MLNNIRDIIIPPSTTAAVINHYLLDVLKVYLKVLITCIRNEVRLSVGPQMVIYLILTSQ
jgi:hypothetical protein